jgi:purine nucleoside permease
MALGLDPRFDLTRSYFLIAGIAGVDPKYASIGSAAWASYVVGDVAREIDSREAPADWPYGLFPVDASAPNPPSDVGAVWARTNLYVVNPKLAAWAYQQTRNLKLTDDPAVASFREGYTGYPQAQRPPFVLQGDSFAADYFWHGKILNQFAEDWVKLFTAGMGRFVMTEMEDSGFMNALERLDRMHRIDGQRVMVLRTGSNYSMQRPGQTALESLTGPHVGLHVAVESAWLCGSTVLRWIVGHWDVTAAHVPE